MLLEATLSACTAPTTICEEELQQLIGHAVMAKSLPPRSLLYPTASRTTTMPCGTAPAAVRMSVLTHLAAHDCGNPVHARASLLMSGSMHMHAYMSRVSLEITANVANHQCRMHRHLRKLQTDT
jgi:hypothetical protein